MVTTKIRKCHRFRDKDNCYKSRHSLFVSCTLHRIQQPFRNYDSWIFTNITTLRLFLTKLPKVVLSNSSKQSWKFGFVDPEWIVCWDKIKFNDIFVILATDKTRNLRRVKMDIYVSSKKLRQFSISCSLVYILLQ